MEKLQSKFELDQKSLLQTNKIGFKFNTLSILSTRKPSPSKSKYSLDRFQILIAYAELSAFEHQTR